jgi:hypothetical protein
MAAPEGLLQVGRIYKQKEEFVFKKKDGKLKFVKDFSFNFVKKNLTKDEIIFVLKANYGNYSDFKFLVGH